METTLQCLRAAGEPTRLRLLAACADADLTVSELTQILGQSQPRISRHLKLMTDSGLLTRFREGSWAFFRAADRGRAAELARVLIAQLPADDPVLALDRLRLAAVMQARAAAAAEYFRDNAGEWNRIRGMHVDEAEVEGAVMACIGGSPVADFLDIGTGTGRLLELMGDRITSGLGVDLSREMLAVARATLDRAGFRHISVRQADLYQLPLASHSYDVVTLHQVLHFLDRPDRALIEAARVLRPGGKLIVVDFAPHEQEELRGDHAHRRLGFRDAEVARWLGEAGLECGPVRHLAGSPLTVAIWSAVRAGPPCGVNSDGRALALALQGVPA